jgi:hypothetical protein
VTACPPISAIFTATLGIVLTYIYLWALLERSDRSVARLGIDSIAATLIYLAWIGAVYGIG